MSDLAVTLDAPKGGAATAATAATATTATMSSRRAADRPAPHVAVPARADRWTPLVLCGPAVGLMLLMLLGPAVVVVGLSLTDYQLGAPRIGFIGLENYRELFADRVFWKSLTNTLAYVATVVPGSVALGLGAAILIESGKTFRAFYRTVFFLPVMATLIAMAIVWEFMLHPQFGLVTLIFTWLGLPVRNWLNDSATALYVLAVIGIWQSFGFNMVLFLAGLTAIPRQYYEALEMDGGSSALERFRRVTWPLLGPVTMFVVIISAIRSFQVFDTVHALTKGGPVKATEVLLYTMYAEGFEFFRSGYAAAVTVVFLAFVLLLTIIKARFFDRSVHYK